MSAQQPPRDWRRVAEQLMRERNEAREEIKRLHALLVEVRKVVIVNRHKQMIDAELKPGHRR